MRRIGSVKPAMVIVVGAALFATGACGGDPPEPKSPASEHATHDDTDERPKMAASAEIGALDEGKVTDTFRGALGDLQACLASGAQRNELEGGGIAFFIKVGGDGRIVATHAEKSTLGDRETEKCMLSALRHRSWPEPQGGDVGLAHNSFDFDMPNDVRPPTDWDESRVRDVVTSLSHKVDECKHGARGDFTATVYVDPDGAALSAGIAESDESGEDAADCLVKALKSAKYPSPGSWPAKVTFSL
ncbi:MAG TPA: AgmX/PglI C-terminal domain-containing protein [Polyangiaceae bacterium]|nr:AgmX/PglI C-terminal domain-containing protein [Polyangiaceae bacterium]